MGAVSTVKTRQVIREFLLRNSEIEAMVGQGVFGAHMNSVDAGTVLQSSPMVIVEFDGGDLRWHGAIEIQFVEIYAYSKNSMIEAAKLYDLVCSAMQHERIAIDGIDISCIARENERPSDGYNKHVEAWFVRGRWLIEGV